MKTRKIYGIILIVLIFVFPFRYSVLSPTPSNTVNLLCMLATILGTLVFMGMTISDGKEKH
jgi:hypothetical protein